MATTPCGASRVPRRCALPSASIMRSWANTPVGMPRSIPIEVTWRLRTPPPVPITSLKLRRHPTSASTSGYTDFLPLSMIERPPTFTTWQNGSIDTTGVSVEDITCLSSRLSRISIDSTWRRVSTCSFMAQTSCSGGNDGADRLAVERAAQVALLQAVDDLHRAAVLGVLHELEHGPLQDHVAKVELQKLVDRDPGNELGVLVLFRVGRVQALLVLDVDHRAGAKRLADEIAARIRPVRRDAADLRVGLPIGVG